MSHSRYTASERRGVLAIALVALILIGGGVTLSLCGRKSETVREIPVVTEHPEMIDSVAIESKKENSDKKGKNARRSSKTKRKTEKTYRRRSPLDEPV